MTASAQDARRNVLQRIGEAIGALDALVHHSGRQLNAVAKWAVPKASGSRWGRHHSCTRIPAITFCQLIAADASHARRLSRWGRMVQTFHASPPSENTALM